MEVPHEQPVSFTCSPCTSSLEQQQRTGMPGHPSLWGQCKRVSRRAPPCLSERRLSLGRITPGQYTQEYRSVVLKGWRWGRRRRRADP